jgi:cell division protein ZapA
MAEVKVKIGGREFEVACRDGEEHFLHSAAAMLDNEADALNDALGRMPETRMLLMAGLMLADKTASLEDQLKSAGGVVEAKQPSEDDQPSAADSALAKRATKAETQLSTTQAELADVKAQLAEVQAEVKAAIEARKSAVATMKEMVGRVEQAAGALKKAG